MTIFTMVRDPLFLILMAVSAILFEQASSRGHIQESDNGLLTFPFTIKNQLTAGLSTLKAALNMREKLLQYQYDFFNNARKEAKALDQEAYIFGAPNDPAKAFHLAEILERHQIEIRALKNDISLGWESISKGQRLPSAKKTKK
jgi:hypothetical protein